MDRCLIIILQINKWDTFLKTSASYTQYECYLLNLINEEDLQYYETIRVMLQMEMEN